MSNKTKPGLWTRYTSKSPIFVTIFAVLLGLVVGALVIIATSPAILQAWKEIFNSWGGIGTALKVTFDNVGAAYRAIFTGSIIETGLEHSPLFQKHSPTPHHSLLRVLVLVLHSKQDCSTLVQMVKQSWVASLEQLQHHWSICQPCSTCLSLCSQEFLAVSLQV